MEWNFMKILLIIDKVVLVVLLFILFNLVGFEDIIIEYLVLVGFFVVEEYNIL